MSSRRQINIPSGGGYRQVSLYSSLLLFSPWLDCLHIICYQAIAFTALVPFVLILTHWGWDKMVAISQTTFQMHFLEWKCLNFAQYNKLSLTFVPQLRINNIPALVQITAWRPPGDKALSEWLMVNLLTHKYVTRPQWVEKHLATGAISHFQTSYLLLSRTQWNAMYRSIWPSKLILKPFTC